MTIESATVAKKQPDELKEAPCNLLPSVRVPDCGLVELSLATRNKSGYSRYSMDKFSSRQGVRFVREHPLGPTSGILNTVISWGAMCQLDGW